MPRRVARAPEKRRGRPPALTPRTADTIINTVLAGNHYSTACALAGIGKTTLYRWIERAEAVDQAIAQGDPYDPAENRYRDFRDRLANARAEAERRAVDVVERSMQGGYVISEEPAVDGNGNPIRGDDGEILWKRTYAQPDGRLALSYLGKSRPDVWGQNPTQRLEITAGAGGDAGEAVGDAVSALTRRLALVQAQRQAESEPTDVHEAELVDDGVSA